MKEKIKSKKVFLSKRSNKSLQGNIIIFIFIMMLALFTALPLYLTIINSLKPLDELWVFPPRLYVLNPSINNYIDLLSVMNTSMVPFSRYIFNTVIITVVGTFGQIIFSSMCAYSISKIRFPGHKAYFTVIVASLMFSPAVTAIPNYLTMANFGWIDTYLALIVPVFGSTLGLYLMKQFIDQINDAMLEAAKIDGANEFRIYWTIIMPLSKSAWLTVMIFSIQSLWGMGASNMIYSENLKTLNYTLTQIVSAGIARAGVGTAIAVVMMIVPITVFIIVQSNVVETMSNSGMKE